jgi:hypothetical protein
MTRPAQARSRQRAKAARQALALCEAEQHVRRRVSATTAPAGAAGRRAAAPARRRIPRTDPPDPPAGGKAMTIPGRKSRISRKERAARAAIGMPARHPEQITRKPGRAEWRQLAAWLAQLWPNDEYTAIVTDTWRQDYP